MEIQYLIKKLEEQKFKADQSDTEVWLRTTYSYIEDYFRIGSSRAMHFRSFITDYNISKGYGVESVGVQSIKRKAIEYIDDIIQYLKELQERQKDEADNARILKESRNEIQTNAAAYSSVKPEIITQLPFGISPPLFWTIFAALISAGFIVGQSIGSAKFDKEKIDFYDQIKILKADTTKLYRTIELKDSLIQKKNEEIKSKQDSLNQVNKDLNNLYLYIGTLNGNKGK